MEVELESKILFQIHPFKFMKLWIHNNEIRLKRVFLQGALFMLGFVCFVSLGKKLYKMWGLCGT